MPAPARWRREPARTVKTRPGSAYRIRQYTVVDFGHDGDPQPRHISEVLDFEVLPLGKAIALSKVEIER